MIDLEKTTYLIAPSPNLSTPEQTMMDALTLADKLEAQLKLHKGMETDFRMVMKPDAAKAFIGLLRKVDEMMNEIARLRSAHAQRAPLNDGLTKAMEIVGNMRQSEAGLFDAKHSGQRGCDRADALYDAYVAIKAALTSTYDQPIENKRDGAS